MQNQNNFLKLAESPELATKNLYSLELNKILKNNNIFRGF